MLVSVITPSYNSEHFVKGAYESLMAQTQHDWEWVVTDDGSSDSTPELLHELARVDARVKVKVCPSNAGPAVARNHSIERATGRYLAFLDIDDRWTCEKLQKQIDFMASNRYAFSHTWFKEIGSGGKTSEKVIKAPERMTYGDMLKSNRVGCLTAVYDTDRLGKVYMPQIRKRQDYGLWLSLLKNTNYVYCLPEVLAYYQVGNQSVSSNKVDLLKYNWQLFYEVEGFSALKSAYYLGWNVFRRITK